MIVIQDCDNRDNEIAIFNPKRVRTPSVVVTNDSPNGPFGVTNVNQITHSDSVSSSQPDGAESLTGLTGVIIGDNIIDSHSHHQPNSLTQIHQHQLPRSASAEHEKPKASCCSELAQKVKIVNLVKDR
jgi:hypothetical protein